MRYTLLDTPDDCQWLRDTHLSARYADQPIPPFQSAAIHGNEDCPDRIELYTSVVPLVTDTPIVYVYDDGRYVVSDAR